MVGTRPVVGIVATGSELQDPSQSLSPGHIYESNRAGLAALVRAAGCKPLVFPVVPDNLELTLSALSDAQNQCSMVLTVGGASVGDFDLVKPALAHLGGQLEFWKVAIKPGRPFVFGQVLAKPLFGLPGNPVSALVTFLLLVRPALRRWQGATDTELRRVSGVLGQPISNPGSRRHFVRVCFAAEGVVQPAGTQASHLLGSFAAAHGLIDVPPGSTLPTGSVVAVRIWEI
jgi:molybdopterin molybdotransferase